MRKLRWGYFLELLGDAVVIAYGGLGSMIFCYLWRYGGITLNEPNRVILTMESILAPLVVLLGVERAIRDIIRRRK